MSRILKQSNHIARCMAATQTYNRNLSTTALYKMSETAKLKGRVLGVAVLFNQEKGEFWTSFDLILLILDSFLAGNLKNLDPFRPR